LLAFDPPSLYENIMPQWLTCQVNKGMFSDECTVIVRTIHGDLVSLFVPRDTIDEQKHRVRVRVIQNGPRVVAVMPDENQSIINVNSSELQPV
jgi:hypothetical protein